MLNEIRLQLDRLRSKRDLSLTQERSDKTNKRLKFYTKIVTKAIDAERCSAFITDPVMHKTWLKAGTGLEEHDIEVPDGDSVVSKVIREGESVRVSNLEKQEGTHKEVDAETGFVTHSILCVPVKSEQRQEVVGALEVLNKRNGKEFDDDDEEMLNEIADHLRMDFDSVFLDQQFLRLSERMYSTARRTIYFLIGGIAVLLLILFLVVFAYVAVPTLSG
jgi:GAF domain-containing protein